MEDSLAANAAAVEQYVNESAGLREALGVSAREAVCLQPLGEGEHNINFKMTVPGERCYVLRVNVLPQPFHDCQVRYEYDALGAVAPSGCTPLPVYVDASAGAPGKGVLVETFCPGRQLDFDALREGDLARCAAIMADYHAIPAQPSCPLHRPADPLRELYAECLERFDVYRASPFEDARISRWVDRLCALTEEAIQRAGVPDGAAHIVNTETLASHFLLPEDAGEARAGWFVDWERPIIGEVAQDLAFFLAPTTTFWDSEFLMPSSGIEGFCEQYWAAVDGRFAPGAFEARFSAWLKVSVLRAVAWNCKALIRYGGSAEHQTSKAAAKIPVYLSDEFLEMLHTTCFSA